MQVEEQRNVDRPLVVRETKTKTPPTTTFMFTQRIHALSLIDGSEKFGGPTAIAGTLSALRSRYPGSRLWAVLEPRSNTLRRNVLQDALAKSLANADEVVIANVFKSDSIPAAERLDLDAVVRHIQAQGKHARTLPEVDSIVQSIAPDLRPGHA